MNNICGNLFLMTSTIVNNLLPRPPIGVRGIVFARFLCFFVSLFVCFFVCFIQQDYEKTAGPICVKFSGKLWTEHGTT